MHIYVLLITYFSLHGRMHVINVAHGHMSAYYVMCVLEVLRITWVCKIYMTSITLSRAANGHNRGAAMHILAKLVLL